MLIYCCQCETQVEARLTTDAEVYKHLPHLSDSHYWVCDTCRNYVGVHKTSKDFKPLGCIATPELRAVRKQLHLLIDSFWQSGKVNRRYVYELLSEYFGKKYHTGNIRSLEEATQVDAVLRYYQQTGVLPTL